MTTSVALALSVVLAACVGLVSAQDPAEGWMAYAVGTVPSGVQRITRFDATWTVGAYPPSSSAFFSPWFGMDPADNLNLIQPVNPWLGQQPWGMYTEYYQWSDGYNSNSDNYDVQAGQTLHGSLVYLADQDAYNLTQTIVETGQTSQQVVPCQNGKKYIVPYFVYEKVWECNNYPPDGIVTFRDIKIECDGSDCTKDVVFQAAVKDPNCDMTAHVDKYPQTVSITWSTSGHSPKASNMTKAELFDYNFKGWARTLLQRPNDLPSPYAGVQA